MQNEQINEFSNQEALTQVASYFDIVDHAVQTGDTNKKYTISTNSCTAPSPPIKNGSWTSVVISPTADNMCDLYNSFITAELHVTVSLSSALTAHTAVNGTKKPGFWIGYKDSMDAISQYQIVANGQSIYTQSNAIEESYITACGTTEMVKKVDVYSKVRHKDIWKGKGTARAGTVVQPDANTTSSTVIIPIKIDCRRFLPLSSIKYVPAFVGNLELRLKFSPEALVVAPLSTYTLLANDYNRAQYKTPEAITNKFVPIGEDFTMVTKLTFATADIAADTTAGTPAYAKGEALVTIATRSVSVKSSDYEVSLCFSHLACFGLDDNLYQSLIGRYSKESLSFPIQTLTFQGMNGGTANANGTVDLTVTSTPRFVDMICILFPYNSNYRTCYENPVFETFTLKMGGYGTIPDVQYNSASAAFYELVTNAFNTNNDLAGFNVDVMRSIVNDENSQTGTESNDITNFVMAFPTSTDHTFQQGQTSNTPITYQFKAIQTTNSPYKDATQCSPIMGFLKDSVLAIQLRPNGPPIVALDEYDITSPAD